MKASATFKNAEQACRLEASATFHDATWAGPAEAGRYLALL